MTLLPILLLSASLGGGGVVAIDGGQFPMGGGVPAGVVAGREWESSLPQPESVEMAQVLIERRVVVRVPMMRIAPSSGGVAHNLQERQSAVEWEERKGPKCISLSQVRGATVTSARGVDMMLQNHQRLRARLGRGCRPEDLYSGFYIQPNADKAICAGRDHLLARSGANCAITEIKRLVPGK